MSTLLDQALVAVLALPDEDQNEIARAMLALAAPDVVELISPAHMAAVLEGLVQARYGQFAEPEGVEAAFKRFGP